jgi:hypothetical protein
MLRATSLELRTVVANAIKGPLTARLQPPRGSFRTRTTCRGRRLATLLCVCVVLILSPCFLSIDAQRLPFAKGDTVRVARSDSAGGGDWTMGHVYVATREYLLMGAGGADPLVRFDEPIRLQVRRNSRSHKTLGALLGLGVGAISGATFLSPTLSYLDTPTSDAQSTIAGTLAYGAIGALVGMLVGGQFRDNEWEEIHFVNGRIPAAPLTDPTPITVPSPNRAIWWTRFDPAVEDFESFFEAHSDSLLPLEGIWKLLGRGTQVAIVRDDRLSGVQYLGYRITTHLMQTPIDGLTVMALSRFEGDGSFSMQFPRGTEPLTMPVFRSSGAFSIVASREFVEQGYRAEFTPGTIRVWLPGGLMQRWDRVFPKPSLDSTAIADATLDPATPLRPVVIEGKRVNNKLWAAGFYGRMQSEVGTFITQEEIAQQNPRTTSELLRRIPGFVVLESGIASAPRRSKCSGVAYYVDGVHADGSDLNAVLPPAIAGLEVYTGPATVPMAFRVITQNPVCGTVLIWLRDGDRQP